MNSIKRIYILAILMIMLFVLPGIMAPWLAIHDPEHIDLARSLEVWSSKHWLGLNEYGADVFSSLLYGARISLLAGFGSATLSAIIGITVGLLSGYYGGWIDEFLMRLVDALLAFPGFLLAIALAAVLEPGIKNVIIALSAVGWTGFARLARARMLTEKERDYVAACQSIGMGLPRIIGRHILPNVVESLAVQFSFSVAFGVIAEASLSYLGIGVPPGTPSWGMMLAEGKHVIFEAPRLSIIPGLMIMLVVLSFNLLGNALQDHFNPLRHKYS